MTLADFLFPMRSHLLKELAQQRVDFDTRLAEKDTTIRQLKVELASLKSVEPKPPERVRTAEVQAAEPGPSNWDEELQIMLQEEEDGIRSRGRLQEHEQGTNDGAQAVDGA